MHCDHMFHSAPGIQNPSILVAPKVVCTLVHLLFANPELRWDSPGDHVELFAGCMSVTKAEWQVWGYKSVNWLGRFGLKYRFFELGNYEKTHPQIWNLGIPSIVKTVLFYCKIVSLKEGRSATPHDLCIGGPSMDLTTPVGFCNAMFMVCNLLPGAALMAAPVCGSWVFMTGLRGMFVVCRGCA